jgi:hypothetical protein
VASANPGWFKRISNLFFIKRRPRFRGIDRDWQAPASDDAYQKMIDQEGFFSIPNWGEDDISAHPVIAQDIRDLEQHLLPTYFEFSQKSKYYQNLFYRYQWIFIWGAFLTTLFGTLAAYYTGPVASAEAVIEQQAEATAEATAVTGAEGDTTTVTESAPVTQDTFEFLGVFGAQALNFMTAIIGATTAYFTALSNRNEPQKRWAITRRLTEELRMNYFKYLAHVTPYEKEDRLLKLREAVLNIRVKEQENV